MEGKTGSYIALQLKKRIEDVDAWSNLEVSTANSECFIETKAPVKPTPKPKKE